MIFHLFNGSTPITIEVEENTYKPKLTMSDGVVSISAELDGCEGEEAFRKFIAIDDDYKDLEAELEEANIKLKEFDNLKASVEAALKLINEGISLLLDLGGEDIREEDLEEAIDKFEDAKFELE